MSEPKELTEALLEEVAFQIRQKNLGGRVWNLPLNLLLRTLDARDAALREAVEIIKNAVANAIDTPDCNCGCAVHRARAFLAKHAETNAERGGPASNPRRDALPDEGGGSPISAAGAQQELGQGEP